MNSRSNIYDLANNGRMATPEESKGVSDYIESISEPVGCPYCLELESLFWHKDNPEVSTSVKEIYIDLDGTLNVELSGYELDCISIPIDYCPKCGRKMKNEM